MLRRLRNCSWQENMGFFQMIFFVVFFLLEPWLTDNIRRQRIDDVNNLFCWTSSDKLTGSFLNTLITVQITWSDWQTKAGSLTENNHRHTTNNCSQP